MITPSVLYGGTICRASRAGARAVEDCYDRDTRGYREFLRALAALGVTAAQRAAIEAAVAAAKPALDALVATLRETRTALERLSPADPRYAALAAAEQSQLLGRTLAAAALRERIHAVLTPAQREAVPAVLAADRAARDARRARARPRAPRC